jgi:predicted nucleic acid-binding protein
MSSVLDITSYQPQKDERFFLDANVWLFLFCPLGGYRQYIIRKYARFLKQAMIRQSVVFITAMVLSEYINRYLRLEYNFLRDGDPTRYTDYKRDFRDTMDGRSLVRTVYDSINRHILAVATPIDDHFQRVKPDDLLAGTEAVDFNDQCYANLAYLEGLKIVTDDSDFSNVTLNIPVLTGNPKLLQHGIVP